MIRRHYDGGPLHSPRLPGQFRVKPSNSLGSDDLIRVDPERPGVIFVDLDSQYRAPQPRLPEAEALSLLLAAIGGGPCASLKAALEEIENASAWRTFFQEASRATLPTALIAEFHTAWSVRGFRMREAVADDKLLAAALRNLLPPYVGPKLTLFRGEQFARFATEQHGFNWTPVRSVAERFAAGLCSLYQGGGVLLQATVPAAAIIAAPGPHSVYLDEHEYVVDPAQLVGVVEIQRYPEYR